MLTRFTNSAFVTTALGFAAAACGVLLVVCLLVGFANIVQWLAGVF